MADNVAVTPGSGASIAGDEISGVVHQRVKVQYGDDGSATDVSASNPLPTTVSALPSDPLGTSSDSAASAGSTGTLSAKLRLMTTQLDAIKTAVETIDNFVSGTEAQVDVLTMPAAARTTDAIAAALQTDAIMNGLTAVTPVFAAISCSSSGNNTLVAAVSAKKTRVFALAVMASSAVNVKFQSGAGGTDISGLFYLAANTGFVLPFNPLGWCETATNTILNLSLSGAVPVGGFLVHGPV
jgi:hypothetical protein